VGVGNLHGHTNEVNSIKSSPIKLMYETVNK
jgi:hypothetical protein